MTAKWDEIRKRYGMKQMRRTCPMASTSVRKHQVMRRAPPLQQGGSAAIEFALVFPLFFLVVYAIISYGMIFVAQQSITMAAAEGARAALRYVDGTPEMAATQQETNARMAAIGPQSVAAWLGIGNLSFNISTTQEVGKIQCPYDAGTDCYKVVVSYPYAEKPLIPLLLGPLMRLAIPTEISSTAIVQLN